MADIPKVIDSVSLIIVAIGVGALLLLVGRALGKIADIFGENK